MTVLITGGTGFLGSALVRAFARAGHFPVVFARRASASGLPGKLVDGDVRDRSGLAHAAMGVDAICHAAALVSVWRQGRELVSSENQLVSSRTLDWREIQRQPVTLSVAGAGVDRAP